MPLDSSPGMLLEAGHIEGTEGWSSPHGWQDRFPLGQPLQADPYLLLCTPAGTSAWEPAARPSPQLLPRAAVRQKKGTDSLCFCSDDKKDYFIPQSCNFSWAPNASTGTINSKGCCSTGCFGLTLGFSKYIKLFMWMRKASKAWWLWQGCVFNNIFYQQELRSWKTRHAFRHHQASCSLSAWFP